MNTVTSVRIQELYIGNMKFIVADDLWCRALGHIVRGEKGLGPFINRLVMAGQIQSLTLAKYAREVDSYLKAKEQ